VSGLFLLWTKVPYCAHTCHSLRRRARWHRALATLLIGCCVARRQEISGVLRTMQGQCRHFSDRPVRERERARGARMYNPIPHIDLAELKGAAAESLALRGREVPARRWVWWRVVCLASQTRRISRALRDSWNVSLRWRASKLLPRCQIAGSVALLRPRRSQLCDARLRRAYHSGRAHRECCRSSRPLKPLRPELY